MGDFVGYLFSVQYHPPTMFNRVLFTTSLFFSLLMLSATAKRITDCETNLDAVTFKDIQSGDVFNNHQTGAKAMVNGTQTEQHSIYKGRGHLHKRRKILKHLYPLLMAALFAKLVVGPLILKLLIASISSAFVMSKIALVTSAVLAVGWLLGATRERAKLQIVQYPGVNSSKKLFGGWNVKDKYSTHYGPYNDWAYEDNAVDSNDKNFFL